MKKAKNIFAIFLLFLNSDFLRNFRIYYFAKISHFFAKQIKKANNFEFFASERNANIFAKIFFLRNFGIIVLRTISISCKSRPMNEWIISKIKTPSLSCLTTVMCHGTPSINFNILSNTHYTFLNNIFCHSACSAQHDLPFLTRIFNAVKPSRIL